jgi:hypothetical protein
VAQQVTPKNSKPHRIKKIMVIEKMPPVEAGGIVKAKHPSAHPSA